MLVSKRAFSLKLMKSPRFTVVDVPDNFLGQRLDRFLMTHYKLPWTATQKMVRSKQAFVVLRKPED